MFRRIMKPAFAILLGSAMFFVASSVEAGFILPELDGSAERLMKSPGTGSPTPQSPAPRPDPWVSQGDLVQVGYLPGTTFGGMSGQSVSSSGSSLSVAILGGQMSAGQILVAWLGPEGRVWFSPPFLSGIFRPPRL